MSDNQREIGNTTFNVNLAGVSDQGFNVTIDSEENYVVLFAGGYDAEANRPYYYNNIKEMYKIVTEVYGIAASNVYILYADGLNNGIDNSLGENSDMSFAASSNVLAATEANLANVFAEISVKADSNDHFLFYSFDHGAEAADGTDYLCAWNSLIKDTDFASYAATITAGYQTYLMSQCYAWGMLEDMQLDGNIFLAGSAASDDTAHMAANDKTGMITAGFAAALEDALAAGISTTNTLYDYIFENNRFAVQDGQQMAGGNFAIFGTDAQEVRYGSYTLEFSSDNFSGSVVIDNAGFMVDIYNFSDNSYQVRAGDSDGKWNDPVTITPETSGSGYIVSVSNGALDIFFAKSTAVWGSGYAARHGGISGSWSGTGEIVDLEGKNQITDIFEGSEDANILLLTDDENGDALFMDDLYSNNAQDARLVRIKEIRAGAGDDIIDLTSERLDYSDAGISVYGGNGDDVIWANKGENKLFGDSGNDRIVGGTGNDVVVGGLGDDTMHGGGGNDIFVLGRDWGNDTITQLADGNVTLWFATGVSGNWDAESMTFSFNGNQVTVSGVSADKVTLKFGNDGSESYKDLSSAGAFAAVTSGTIFTENETIYTNEILADTTVYDTVYINSYETASNVTIENGGELHISGGSAYATTVNGGRMCVYDSSFANHTTINSGSMDVYCGSATDINVSEGSLVVSGSSSYWYGTEYLSCGSASGVTLNYGASANIGWFGQATQVEIKEGGYLTVDYCGSASEVSVHYNGTAYICDSAVATQNTIYEGGCMHVAYGGSANSTTILSGGYLNLESGANAENTIIANGASLTVSDGVSLYKASITDGGEMTIESGASAAQVNFVSGGHLNIASGGTATNLNWTPCVGTVNSASGAHVTYASNYYGVYYGSNNELTSHDYEMSNLSVTWGQMYVMSQGRAYNIDVQYDGKLYVSYGGYVNSAKVHDSGYIKIESGASAYEICENGGFVEVAEGAEVTFAENTFDLGWLYGSATVHSNTTVSGGYICNNASMFIYEGGRASNIFNENEGLLNIYSGAAVENTTISGSGQMNIASGGTATNTTVNGATLTVASGGTATQITENGGYVKVEDGATVDFISNTINNLKVSYRSATVHSNTIVNNASAAYAGSIDIFSGGIVNGVTVNSHAMLNIASGGTATQILENGGYVNAEAGAAVDFISNTMIDLKVSYGSATVHSNTVLSNTTITYYGKVDIFHGGVAVDNTVASGGSMAVYAGGTAANTVVNSSGLFVVSSGGTATKVLENGGYVDVAKGANVEFESQILSGLSVYNRSMTAHSNTVLSDTKISYNAQVDVVGGKAFGNVVSGGGIMSVSDGGTAENNIVSHGSLTVREGGKITDTTVRYGSITVDHGGHATSTTINNSGSLIVSSGGTASNTIVNSGGFMQVSSGGTAVQILENGGFVETAEGANVEFISNTISGIKGYANITVHSNTVLTDVEIGGGVRGSIYIYSGGMASDVKINSYASMAILSGGTAVKVIENGGYISVADGANVEFASNIISGGSVWREATIHSNTVMSGTVISNCGNVHVYDGGKTEAVSVYYGGALYLSGGIAEKTTLSGSCAYNNSDIFNASMNVFNTAVANDITLRQYAELTVYSGGVVNDVNISSYMALLALSSGGTANNVAIGSGGSAAVFAGGVVNEITVYPSGSATVFDGGIASDVLVTANGTFTVSSGGTATIVFNPWQGTVNSSAGANVTFLERDANVYLGKNGVLTEKSDVLEGKTISYNDSALIYSGGVMNNNTLTLSGVMHIYDGGIANSTTFVSGGNLYIHSGGTANSTEMVGHYSSYGQNIWSYPGNMYVFSGGTANDVKVNSRATLYISGGTVDGALLNNVGTLDVSNGTADNTIVNYGGQFKLQSGTANSNTINSGGRMFISSGAVANNNTVNGGGSMFISSGGVASKSMVSGRMFVSSGAVANNNTINSYGSMFISSGAVASNTTVNGSGYMYVSGGVASNTTVTSKGNMYISDSGIANGIAVSSGGNIYISSGGTVENMLIVSGANISLNNGTLRNAELDAKARLTLGQGTVDTFIVNSNAFLTTSDTAMSNLHIKERGAAYISGGIVSDSEVDNLGILQFCSGTTANNTLVHSGGHCYIGSGAVHSGTLTIEEGATVLAFTGSELNFTIAGRTADSDALVNNLSLIRGNISYSITVSADQDSGIYRLADNVGEFTGDLKLFFGDETFENFSLGEVIESNGASFELSLENDSLLLEVFTPELQESAIFDEGNMLQGIEQFSIFDPMLAGNDSIDTNSGSELFKNGILA